MPASDAPTRPLGTLRTDGTLPAHSGFGAWYEDNLEHVPDVTYPDSVTTFHRMRRDPTLAQILAGYWHPILSGPAHVDPAGASDLAVRAVADSLGLPVLGDDTQQGTGRNRGVQWREHLRLALLKLAYGHMGFEPWYEIRDGRALLAGLPERMPYSVDRIHVHEKSGEFLGITQKGDPSRLPTDVPQIRADRLAWYVNDREGAAWWGQSLLRPSFAPWLLKWELMRLHPTTLRRFGSGTPTMEPLPGTNPTPAETQAAMRAAQSIRVGDTAGVATPGFRLRIVGVEGTLPDPMPFLRYLDEQMARSCLYSLLDLGSTANGSRALGDNFADILGKALQGVADHLAVEATEQLAARIVGFNEGEGAAVPRIVFGDVAATEQALATTVSTLVQTGALTHDPELEGHLRRVFDLPAATQSGAQPPGPVPPVAASRPTRAPRAAAGTPIVGGRVQTAEWPYSRPLTATEVKAALDPQAIDRAEQDITDATLTAWAVVFAAQRDDLLTQIQALVDAGDLEGLAALTVDTTDAGKVLADAAQSAVDEGLTLAGTEAAGQGVTLTVPETVPDLGPWARGIAGTLGQGLATAAGREALRLAGPGATGADVAAGVGEFLDGLTDAAVRDAVVGVVGAGLNQGRAAAVATGPTARYIHSSIRDRSTCSRCAAMDEYVYPTLADAEAAFPTGGYIACEGRFRCRCIFFTDYSGGSGD